MKALIAEIAESRADYESRIKDLIRCPLQEGDHNVYPQYNPFWQALHYARLQYHHKVNDALQYRSTRAHMVPVYEKTFAPVLEELMLIKRQSITPVTEGMRVDVSKMKDADTSLSDRHSDLMRQLEALEREQEALRKQMEMKEAILERYEERVSSVLKRGAERVRHVMAEAISKWREFTEKDRAVETAALERASAHHVHSTMARAMTGWKEVTDRASVSRRGAEEMSLQADRKLLASTFRAWREDTRKTYKEVLLRQKQEQAAVEAAVAEDIVLEVVNDLVRGAAGEELLAAKEEAEAREVALREEELRARQEELVAREEALREEELRVRQEAQSAKKEAGVARKGKSTSEDAAPKKANADAKGTRRRRRRKGRKIRGGQKKGGVGIAAAGGPKVKEVVDSSDLDAWLDAQVEANKEAIAKHAAEQEALRKAEAERQVAEELARKHAEEEARLKSLAEDKVRMEADVECAVIHQVNFLPGMAMTVSAEVAANAKRWQTVAAWGIKYPYTEHQEDGLSPEVILMQKARKNADTDNLFRVSEWYNQLGQTRLYVDLLSRVSKLEEELDMPCPKRVCTANLANYCYMDKQYDVAADMYKVLSEGGLKEAQFQYARSLTFSTAKFLDEGSLEKVFARQDKAIMSLANPYNFEGAQELVSEIVRNWDDPDSPLHRDGWRGDAALNAVVTSLHISLRGEIIHPAIAKSTIVGAGVAAGGGPTISSKSTGKEMEEEARKADSTQGYCDHAEALNQLGDIAGAIKILEAGAQLEQKLFSDGRGADMVCTIILANNCYDRDLAQYSELMGILYDAGKPDTAIYYGTSLLQYAPMVIDSDRSAAMRLQVKAAEVLLTVEGEKESLAETNLGRIVQSWDSKGKKWSYPNWRKENPELVEALAERGIGGEVVKVGGVETVGLTAAQREALRRVQTAGTAKEHRK
jgi:hypothetical protein